MFHVAHWWDFLTVFRIMDLAPMIAAWAAVAFFTAPWIEEAFDRATAGYVKWMIELGDRMFMTLRARWCALAILGSMVFALLLGLLVTAGLPMTGGYHVLRFVICVVLVVSPLGHGLPRMVMNWMWNRRVELFGEQMLDALAFMSNGLKSGLSLLQCMDMVRAELPNPISEEFALMLSEQRLGVPLEEALINLEKRIGSEDLQIMVTSINILRQSGGNLSETFDTIAHTIRERQKVEGRIKTLTAQGVAQGVIITILPFALGFILWLMDPQLISRMWTTAIGWGMLIFMMTLQAIGAFLIRKIVQIRV